MPFQRQPSALSFAVLASVALLAASGCTSESPAPSAAPTATTPPGALDTVATAASRAVGNPEQEVRAAMDKFATVGSYHAVMEHEAGPKGTVRNEVDFVAPDRFRMVTQMGTQIIIGDTMHMTVQGRAMKVPLPAGTLTQWRDPANLAQAKDNLDVRGEGRDSVDGVAASKYRVKQTGPAPSDLTLWIGDNGYPVQMRVEARPEGLAPTVTLVRYSRINDATLKIDPPQG